VRSVDPVGGSGKTSLFLGRSTGELRAYLVSFVLAAVVGVAGGFAAIGFQHLTDVARVLLIGGSIDDRFLDAARELAWWQRLLMPAFGAAIASFLLYVVFRWAHAQSNPDVLETVSLRKGGIPLAPVVARSVATCAVIGSGGSSGREGPIIQIASAIASTIGSWTRLRPRDLSVLIACGAAAGMAGAYNAPIGAAMFVMEVILGSFVMETFAPVIVASVTSALTVRAVSDVSSVYDVPHFTVANPWEALPIFALGLLSALVGWGLLRTLWSVETLLGRVPVPRWALPVVGGLLVGAIGIALPEVWGNGYDAVSLVLKGAIPLGFTAALLPAKAVATGITSGSGIAGGVFTPTLFVGAALGATFGGLLHAAFPHAGLQPGLFALIGMGSVLAATTHAPLMAILVLFEMTLDPHLIAPLMLGAVTATLFARWIHADSIYTARLKRRGVRLPEGVEEAALLRTYARDLVRTEADTLPANAPIQQVLDVFLHRRRDALYVVGDGGRYVGVARIHDVKAVFGGGGEGATIIAMDVAVPVEPVAEDEAIAGVLARFDDPELDEVPVVASRTDPRFVGTLSRRDILAMLRHEVLVEESRPVRMGSRAGTGSAYVELPDGWRISEVAPPLDAFGRPADPAAWAAARGGVPLVVLRPDGKGGRDPLPPSTTALRHGDVLVVMAPVLPPGASPPAG
jgi:CIC family chloride channel protein